MAASTHRGTCQVCGRGQKLPAGRLSKQGYTVDWGFFSGVCPGALAEPLETSRALLDSIAVELLAQAERLDTDEPATIVCDVAYRPSSTYRREPGADGRVENTIEAFRALGEANRDRWINYGWYSHAGADTVATQYAKAVDVAKRVNRNRAKSTRAHVAHMRALAETVHGKPLELIAKITLTT